MVNLSIDIKGLQDVNITLDRFKARASDATEPLNTVADDLATLWSAMFTSSGSSEGQRWAPLSPKYAEWKAKAYPGQPILTATGKLAQSMSKRPFSIEKISADSLTAGTNNRTARWHQYGTPRMPARPVLHSVNKQRTREWVKIFQRHLLEAGN